MAITKPVVYIPDDVMYKFVDHISNYCLENNTNVLKTDIDWLYDFQRDVTIYSAKFYLDDRGIMLYAVESENAP